MSKGGSLKHGSLLVDQGDFGIVEMRTLQLVLEIVHFGRKPAFLSCLLASPLR